MFFDEDLETAIEQSRRHEKAPTAQAAKKTWNSIDLFIAEVNNVQLPQPWYKKSRNQIFASATTLIASSLIGYKLYQWFKRS